MSASRIGRLLGALGVAWALLATAGCKTQAFCFEDCAAGGGSGTSTSATSSGQGGGGGGDCGLFGCGGGGGAGGGECVPSGAETCDGKDNDCNGKVDDVDFSDPKTCGNCNTNCYDLAVHCNPAGTTCDPGASPGVLAGTCGCTDCATDYYDFDGDGLTCEQYCVKVATDDTVCNTKDDDCDGVVDEDVDFCAPEHCGSCDVQCNFIHASGQCKKTGNSPCGPNNTSCDFTCDCNGPGDCWFDANGLSNDGCEYACDVTNGGIEICDGIDNDCDGFVDATDDLSGDLAVGVVCNGDPDGECGKAIHQGTTVCQGGKVVCGGANVLHENEVLELCNSLDDDCDGLVDDFPIDAGGSCGGFSIAPCALGTQQCQNGQLVCVGAIGPQPETCNSVDDDCDGVIDSTNGMPPSDSVGACNVPPPAPPGASQPCQAGQKACLGGVVVCVNSVGPTSNVDACNVDSNCDGSLDNQPNLMSDVSNCGSCGNDCYTGSLHSAWACVNGACQFQGCLSGYWDLNNDQKCEYACQFVQAQETCNAIDDNCNGQIDEGVVPPSPVQVCGVSPSATRPECTSMVSVTCSAQGQWACSFPAGVCGPSCAAAAEICDTLDNNCNGSVNENVPNFGQPCASDDGKAYSDGACRTTGTFVCQGNNATVCSAVTANCANLPGGCTELCDGIDNDCDGVVDETYNKKNVGSGLPGAPAANPTFFVKPAVIRNNIGKYIYQYEASRPNSTNLSPGSGDGYQTSAPVGETLDKTISCSVPNRIPWFNVTPDEVEQTCVAVGGHICNSDLQNANCGGWGDWERACGIGVNCTWGYSPYNSNPPACQSQASATKYCNLGNTYDFDPLKPGIQNGLLPTGSPLVQNCYADMMGQYGNAFNQVFPIYDITGNLREITKRTCPKVFTDEYPLMGGSFLSQDENGATCSYDFYTVSDKQFKLYDTGFRCCFDVDPTL